MRCWFRASVLRVYLVPIGAGAMLFISSPSAEATCTRNPINDADIPSTAEQMDERCRHNSRASADAHPIDNGESTWRACRSSYSLLRNRVDLYNRSVRDFCTAVEAHATALQQRTLNQSQSQEEVERLEARVKEEQARLSRMAEGLARTLRENADLNKSIIEGYRRDKQAIDSLRNCDPNPNGLKSQSLRTNRCVKAYRSVGSEERMLLEDGTEIQPSRGAAATVEQYHDNIDVLIREQSEAEELSRRIAVDVERDGQSRVPSSAVAAHRDPQSDLSNVSGTSTLDNSLKGAQIAQMAGAAGQRGSAAPAASISGVAAAAAQNLTQRIGTGASSSKAAEKLIGTDTKTSAKTDERTQAYSYSSQTGSEGTKTSGGIAGFSPSSGGSGARAVVSGTSTRGAAVMNGGNGRNGGRNGSAGSNGSDNSYDANSSGSRPGFAGAGDSHTPTDVMKNFTGRINGQVDNLDGQSEIAKILGEMQSMFSGDPTASFGSGGGFNNEETASFAATSGITREDEISRFEKVEKKVSEQGARALASAEGLTEFSLFSRVHRRHNKSQEKGLVVSGLRHRVE